MLERDISPAALELSLYNGNIGKTKSLLDNHFESVAKGEFIWLNELREHGYGTEEISKLLFNEKNDSPWIYIEPKDIPPVSIVQGHHQQLCVHTGGYHTRIDGDPKSSKTRMGKRSSPSIPDDEEVIHLEELCGLAGITPNTREMDKWVGSVEFLEENNTLAALVSFDATLTSDDPIIETDLVIHSSPPIPPKNAVLQLCSNILKALDNLCTAIGHAQRGGMCCNSFTILALTPRLAGKRAIEIVQIRVEVISQLMESLEAYLKFYLAENALCHFGDLERDVFNCSERLLRQALPSRRSSLLTSLIQMLDSGALATQVLCLGFASYIKAHIGAFQPFFLDTPVEVVVLFGSRDLETTSIVTASLFRLTCMDDMIQSPVLVFHEDFNQNVVHNQQRYDLLASPVNLVDTWGPGQFSTEETKPALDKLTCVLIGGGVIQPTLNDTNILHWSRELEPNLNHSVHFSSTKKYLIGGGVLVNPTCQASRRERWSSFFASLQNLGTSPDYWKVTENEVEFSLLGQQIVGAQLQFNKTWTWYPGNSWKTHYLSLLDELPFTELDRPWGLQVSCCTGVSRRVPLRVLLADVMPIFAKNLAISPGWATLQQRGITEALEVGGGNFKQWYDDLANLTNSQELQALAKGLIRHILLVLRDTGIDREHKNFLIACPQDHSVGKPISMCLPVPCENAGLWAKILTDSEQCATFACMTTLCFESQEHKCQKTNPWHCPSLDTAVQQLRGSNEPILISQTSWNLNVNTKYWIGTPDSGLQAKVVRTPGSSFTRLEISESAVPKRTRARLGVMSGLLPKMEHLRERQVDTWPAEDVLVLSSPR